MSTTKVIAVEFVKRGKSVRSYVGARMLWLSRCGHYAVDRLTLHSGEPRVQFRSYLVRDGNLVEILGYHRSKGTAEKRCRQHAKQVS